MSGAYLENRTFDEIRVGDSASLVRTLTSQDLRLFAAVSGDVNPTHVDEEYARQLPLGPAGGPQPLERALISGCARDAAARSGHRVRVAGPAVPRPGAGRRHGDGDRHRPREAGRRPHRGVRLPVRQPARRGRGRGHRGRPRAGRARPRALAGAPGGGGPGAQQVRGAARALPRAAAGPRGRGLPVRRGVAGGRRRGGRRRV